MLEGAIEDDREKVVGDIDALVNQFVIDLEAILLVDHGRWGNVDG